MNDGDDNTKFFHAAMKTRFRSNAILEVKKGPRVVVLVSEVKEEINNHFAARFLSPPSPIPFLRNINFECLSTQDGGSLEEVFSEEGIKSDMFDGNGDKSLGPVGFNLEFMKKCWDIVGVEVVGVIQEFHKMGKLSKSVTSFLALIPNVIFLKSLRIIGLFA